MLYFTCKIFACLEDNLNFKKIEMVGFKSFADFVKINFDSGITAIVGPNGCGKSNVADAIRWVLGEQSSKMLRGSNMQDVIFKGTEKRKSLSFCEVSLFFDNANKIFRSDYEEIAITRKLYRSGESEYLINSTPCRLKDIVDMLHDSGIGKSGYSIIGQGKVDEIINSKPVDRRAIFEEAAGIAKFKFKKVEAERKLERTQDNLIRINDILSEIDRQLKPLQHQSEVAKKYLELKEKLKLLEVNAYIYQHDYAAANKAEIQTKINAILEELHLRESKLNETIKQYNDTFEQINNIDAELSELNNIVLNLTVGLEKQAGEANLIKEKINNCEMEEFRLTNEIKKLTDNSAEFKVQLSDKQALKNSKIHALELANQELSDVNEKFNNIANELSTSENEAQETQKLIFETLNKLGDVKAQISALKAEQASYSQQLENLNQSQVVTQNRFKESEKNMLASKQELSKLEKVKTDFDAALNKLLAQQTQLMQELKVLESELNTTGNNIISLENRKKMLEDMQREYEGYHGSVKRLLTDAEKNGELKKNIVGVVASLIKVPQKFETAIEMALGNAVQNIITYSDDGAKQLVNYLKQKEYGKATFLPINTVKPRYLDNALKSSLNKQGCYGIASELIDFDSKINNIMSSLLGTTVVVEDINVAVSLAKSVNYAYRIVTLDGDLINPQGSITGGSKKAQVANILSRENTIEQIEKNVAKLKQEHTGKLKLQSELADKVAIVNENVKKTSHDLHNSEIALAAEGERFNKFSQLTSELEIEINKLSGDIAKAEQIVKAISEELNKLSSTATDYNAQPENLEHSYSKFDDLRKKRDEYSMLQTNLKVEVASLNSELLSLDNEIERLKFAIVNNDKILTEYKDSLNRNTQLLSNYKSAVSSINESEQSSDSLEKLEHAKVKLKSISDRKLELQSGLRVLEEERMQLTSEVGRLNDRKYQQELNLSKIDTDIETLQEKVFVEYELTYDTAQAYKVEDFDIKHGLIDINKIRREINGLGNVNVNAIEDYKLLEERHGSLYAQAEDLIKAEADLKKIIKDLSNEMVSRFETEFNKINANFSVVFKELFGGGNARLQLLESEDILEAGVDIIAEPPGKKLSNIALLSGGEKALTAIAILFAILRLRPMPFCLLDEIEAPLDEANVVRFANYLKRYSNETQFIVITHKKTTMEYADALYGVTMEEKGVSKVVSVKLSEATKNVEVK